MRFTSITPRYILIDKVSGAFDVLKYYWHTHWKKSSPVKSYLLYLTFSTRLEVDIAFLVTQVS